MAASLAPAKRHHWRSKASISRSRAGRLTPVGFTSAPGVPAVGSDGASAAPASLACGADRAVSLLIRVCLRRRVIDLHDGSSVLPAAVAHSPAGTGSTD